MSCDDNAALTMLMRHLLDKKGFSVRTASDGYEGKKPYTIVITSQESAEMREQALAKGSNEVWRKPFNAATLIARIETLISQGAI